MTIDISTLSNAGPLGAGDYSVVVQGGVMKKLPVLASGRGTQPAKLLIVDPTTHIRDVSPVDDVGWVLRSIGPDNNFCRINPNGTGGLSWDYSQGAPFFYVARESNGPVDLMAGSNLCAFTASIAPGTGGNTGKSVLTVTAISSGALAVGQVINTGDLAVFSRTRIVAQLSGTTGGTGTYEVKVNGAVQQQTVSSRSMTTGVLIFNMTSAGALENGPDIFVRSTEPDIWTVS